MVAQFLFQLAGIRASRMDVCQARECSDFSCGFGPPWPDLDEDFGVEGIMLGKQSKESPQSFEKWLQA